MKFQLCVYVEDENSPPQIGIAKLSDGVAFGTPDTAVIINCTTMEKVESVYDYKLQDGALTCMDTDMNTALFQRITTHLFNQIREVKN